MAVGSRLVSLFSLSSIAVLICSLQATPVAALSVDHAARGLHHPAHDALARRKRSTNSKRCKPRPAPSSATASSSGAPASSSSAPAAHSPSPSSTSQQSSVAPAPSPSQAANKNIGGNNKAGLAWANGPDHLDEWSSLSQTLYTWAPECPSNAQSLGITCCPMLWGWDQVDRWTKEVMNTNPPCVMGPNEPEIAGQSNMSPSSALLLWNTYIRPMKQKGAILISPATTSDPAGKVWMSDFFSQCGGKCDVDIFATHYYDVSADNFIKYLEELHNLFKMDIWVTEFACQSFNTGVPQCTSSDVWQFEAKATAFMKQTDWVKKYFAFGVMQDMQGVNPDNKLMNADFTPNALAKAYFS